MQLQWQGFGNIDKKLKSGQFSKSDLQSHIGVIDKAKRYQIIKITELNITFIFVGLNASINFMNT